MIAVRDLESWTGRRMMRNSPRRAWNESMRLRRRRDRNHDFYPPGGRKVSDSFRRPSSAGRSISPESTGPERCSTRFRYEREYLMVSILGLGEGAKVAPIAIRIAIGVQERS